ncbi:MAG: ice-binding family protein, partial [Acidimicrobiales bacterium]
MTLGGFASTSRTANKAGAQQTVDPSVAEVLQSLASPARLKTAGNFAILAGSTITNTGVTTIGGDVGLDPGSAITGFAPCPTAAPPTTNCVVLNGATHISDGVSLQAKTDLVAAYNDLLSLETSCTPVNVELATQTFLPGVYCSPTFNLSTNGTVTLDANGDPDAQFIFLTGAGGTTLITGSGSTV